MTGSRPSPTSGGPARTQTLAGALDAVAAVASEAGVDAGAARREALLLAAAVAESAPRAAADWGEAAGGTSTSTQDFFDAASRGRRWRDSPTANLARRDC